MLPLITALLLGRLSAAPDIPTFEEAGIPGVEGSSWQGRPNSSIF